eukprot:Protomagalhaensia_sp_Gyna_25__2952@NODE_2735_length_919_cov_1935_179545_g2281_i0_p1_GENE_NODE_2735_length_919_cov_1935_179545_g2281_i0NODE_2735_length_919_cov_1935_179545_g2281_i0_p1_ORF_typecomplete_len248_score27_83Clat_adaptor_s/PF01217_20/3_8e10Clat_adaptor_s/PF01217_20/4_4e03RLL/PF10036_9/0_014RlaP/PF10127_9/0_02UPF0236/PF06782_11/6_1UPF0236/PF06782_11/9_4Peptidase_U57/PF05582_12/0_15AAA_23/PF13476_6/0_12LCD1/PF09798_9/0_27Pex26/PF07163_12/0_43SMC_N/PF02463_19/0_73_NODE_2735_length_919_cov_
MVVICAAILSKTKTLLCRQFVSISRLRVAAIIQTFLSLMESQTQRAKTMLESDSVRYLFVPIEGAYLVLVTDKCSNIITDSETLRVFQQIVGDICPGAVTLENVTEHACDILFAIDELISIAGTREVVTFAQIKEYLAMESQEEKLQNLIRYSKEQEENQRRRKKAQELDREKMSRLEAEKQMMKLTARLQAEDHTPSSNMMLTSTAVADNPATLGPTIVAPIQHSSVMAGGPRKGLVLGKKKTPVV